MPDGALIIKSTNCKDAANLALPDFFLISPGPTPSNRRPDIIWIFMHFSHVSEGNLYCRSAKQAAG